MKFIQKNKLVFKQIKLNKKQNLKFKLWIFLKFLPKMKKRKTKCLNIQKKGIKKVEKVDLDNNFKCLLTITRLKNKRLRKMKKLAFIITMNAQTNVK